MYRDSDSRVAAAIDQSSKTLFDRTFARSETFDAEVLDCLRWFGLVGELCGDRLVPHLVHLCRNARQRKEFTLRPVLAAVDEVDAWSGAMRIVDRPCAARKGRLESISLRHRDAPFCKELLNIAKTRLIEF